MGYRSESSQPNGGLGVILIRSNIMTARSRRVGWGSSNHLSLSLVHLGRAIKGYSENLNITPHINDGHLNLQS